MTVVRYACPTIQAVLTQPARHMGKTSSRQLRPSSVCGFGSAPENEKPRIFSVFSYDAEGKVGIAATSIRLRPFVFAW